MSIKLFSDPMWDRYFEPQGSGVDQPYSTVPFKRSLGPALVVWASGATAAQKRQWVSMNNKDFVWQRLDGTWVVQDKPPSMVTTGQYFTPAQMVDVGKFVKNSQRLSFDSTDPALDATFNLETLTDAGFKPTPVAPPQLPLPVKQPPVRLWIQAEVELPGVVKQLFFWDGQGWQKLTA